jgi:hypothetical protein
VTSLVDQPQRLWIPAWRLRAGVLKVCVLMLPDPYYSAALLVGPRGTSSFGGRDVLNTAGADAT